MSWSYSVTGRAGALAKRLPADINDIRGAIPGSAEETAKDMVGEIAAGLCASLREDAVVRITAAGSAWRERGEGEKSSFRSHYLEVKLETLSENDGRRHTPAPLSAARPSP